MPGIIDKVTLPDTSPFTPELASAEGRLFIAWRGDGNNYLNIEFSSDDGKHFGGKFTSQETSSQPPALASSGGRLFIAWKGEGNDKLNVAEVKLSNGPGGFKIDGLTNKITSNETSPQAPGLTTQGGKLFISWKGDGNDNLNVAQVQL